MKSFRRCAGPPALAVLGLLPLGAAAALGTFARPDSAAAWLGVLGRAAGILGTTGLLLAAALSVRVPGFDAWFGGLTRLWKLHHLLGAASFLLLMAHPLLLAFAAGSVSRRAAAAVLLPGASAWSLWAGWGALAAMAVFLAPTFAFFGAPDYRRWKALHALSGLAVLLGTGHALASGRSLQGAWGASMWGGLGGLALLAFVYRMVLSRAWGRRPHIVTAVTPAGRGVVELSLKPDGERLVHRAGQFVYLTPLDPALAAGRGEEHPYTLSSAPGEPLLRVAIKDLGDATRALQAVAAGSAVLVEGPYGGLFAPDVADAPELWIAGGIGVTPFLGRARGWEAGRRVDVRLVFCVQDETRAHFLKELEAVAARVPGFEVVPHYFAREGPLVEAFLRARCPDFAEREVYACGPPPLLAVVRAVLRRAGAPASRVHLEDFTWL